HGERDVDVADGPAGGGADVGADLGGAERGWAGELVDLPGVPVGGEHLGGGGGDVVRMDEGGLAVPGGAVEGALAGDGVAQPQEVGHELRGAEDGPGDAGRLERLLGRLVDGAGAHAARHAAGGDLHQ